MVIPYNLTDSLAVFDNKIIKKTRIYPYKRNVLLRSNLLYKKQAQSAENSKKACEGIKGENFLPQFCEFPDSILIDSMHLFGIVKHFLTLWFDSKNSDKLYYLGRFYFTQFLKFNCSL